MNEQLQQALTDILNSVLSAKDFILKELPDVITQLLLWKFWENFLMFVIAILLLPIIFFGARKTIRLCIENAEETDPFDKYSPLVMFNIFWGLAFLPFFDFINFKWLQIWLAPKIFLIEYATMLTR